MKSRAFRPSGTLEFGTSPGGSDVVKCHDVISKQESTRSANNDSLTKTDLHQAPREL
jgi:hypothetical protein